MPCIVMWRCARCVGWVEIRCVVSLFSPVTSWEVFGSISWIENSRERSCTAGGAEISCRRAEQVRPWTKNCKDQSYYVSTCTSSKRG